MISSGAVGTFTVLGRPRLCLALAAAIFATFTYGLGLMLPAGVLKALLP